MDPDIAESLQSIQVSDEYEPLPFQQGNDVAKPEFRAKDGWNSEQKGPPEIQLDELIYDENRDFLGEGTFGKVYKGRCRGQAVAIKVPIMKTNLTKEELEDFRHEVSVMSQIFHPNVVLFMGAATASSHIRIVTELMSTDLESFLRKNGTNTPLATRIRMAKDAALGMNWLHGINRIIHRDLKPANLLVDENNRVKVTDFGFVRPGTIEEWPFAPFLSAEIKPTGAALKDQWGPRGTALWMAPEVMQQQEFDESVDVYSFGIVLWEIYTTKEPFSNHDSWDEFFEAVVKHHERPPIDDACPMSLRRLMEACWNANRKLRPSFPEIIFRLDEVLVDIEVKEPKARDFWKKYFLVPKNELQEKVSWSEFVRALLRSTKTKDKTKFECLQQVLVRDGKVHMSRFYLGAVWFGNWFTEDSMESALKEINLVLQAPWYHGDIEKTTAENRLSNKPSGTFLVRLSTTFPEYPFTISMIKKQHKRIRRSVRTDGTVKFTITSADNKTVHNYGTLSALISGVSKEFNLKHACAIEDPLDGSSYL